MKVLLSAYACEPARGSEPDIGFQTMLAIAERHQVWVITRRNNVPSLEEFLQDDSRKANITLVGIDLNPSTLKLKELLPLGTNWYYDRWQAAAGRLAIELDQEVNFDTVYHVTFASYWAKVGVASVDKPLLIGPVGGAVETPRSLLSELGIRGAVEELLRVVGRRAWFRFAGGRVAVRRARYILTNNRETASTLARIASGSVAVLPNPTAVKVPTDLPVFKNGLDIAFIGRLIPWKALHLAVRTLRRVETPGTRLLVFGDGPERRRVERAITRWRLRDRVVFFGQRGRAEVLDRLSRCAVLVHPALHEEGGNVIAEALAMNVPVVCLDRGGPPLTLRFFPSVRSLAVRPQRPEATARDMAQAIDRFLQSPQPRPRTSSLPSVDYKHEVLLALESIAEPPRDARKPGAAEPTK